MDLNNLLFGKPLRSSDEAGEKLGPIGGLSVFGLDALSSAAYGPEAALTLLIVLGAAGITYIVPITASIIILLTIVYFSYRQTIQAYPNGGGSYTVARENLGEFPGLLAAAALMIDYVLTAAVGISAGVGALVSAAPSLLPHTLAICIVILLLITLVNLRGARETGAVFIFPTYIFIGTLLITLFIGLFKTLAAGGHPSPVVVPPTLPLPTAAVSLWLLLKAFSSGCTAMTGVEAVSNGVKAFRDPVVKSAQRALTAIIAILIVLLGGIAFLVRAYHIGATDPGKAGWTRTWKPTSASCRRESSMAASMSAIRGLLIGSEFAANMHLTVGRPCVHLLAAGLEEAQGEPRQGRGRRPPVPRRLRGPRHVNVGYYEYDEWMIRPRWRIPRSCFCSMTACGGC